MLATPLSMATAAQVWDLLAEHVRPGRVESVPADRAIGCVLARDVLTEIDFPPFDRAMMDGYAVQAADVTDENARLTCVGLVRAGVSVPAIMRPGQCVRINTGAPLPPGADAVVMVEHATEHDDHVVGFHRAVRVGDHIQRRGALRQRGATIVAGGVEVRAGALAAIVSGGVEQVSAFRRPIVAVLSTGDELADANQPLHPGQIHDSNQLALAQLVVDAGAPCESLRRAPDDPSALRAALERGLSADLLCVIGGMSKGTHDLVPQTLEELGVTWLVTSLNLKPGKPTRIGRSPRGGWVLGLPGNPVSCAICFLLFGLAIVRGLTGRGAGRVPMLKGLCESDVPENGSRPMFHPAVWSASARGDALVQPMAWHGSGDPFLLAAANALVHRVAHAAPTPRGEMVDFVPIGPPQ